MFISVAVPSKPGDATKSRRSGSISRFSYDDGSTDPSGRSRTSPLLLYRQTCAFMRQGNRDGKRRRSGQDLLRRVGSRPHAIQKVLFKSTERHSRNHRHTFSIWNSKPLSNGPQSALSGVKEISFCNDQLIVLCRTRPALRALAPREVERATSPGPLRSGYMQLPNGRVLWSFRLEKNITRANANLGSRPSILKTWTTSIRSSSVK